MSAYQIVQGDCVDHMWTMADGSVSAVITDIPYGEVNRASNGLRALDKGTADSAAVPLRLIAREFSRISQGWVFVFCGTEQVSTLRRMFVRAGMSTRLGVWRKTDPSPLNGEYFYLSGIEACVIAKHPKAPFFRHCVVPDWRGPAERNINWHPTPKPVWLMREIVTASVPVGGLVFDPFMGSGSVGVACMEEGRNFIGCELNAEWCEKARTRIGGSQYGLFGGAA